ncbi:hypothetical protein PHJA_000459400 [Phtheirospermum japonicum]|uniref:Senescence regulator n=1 Tax=Phtheirospermum japonicum TaxID=374723 RepID=A0A830B681_9LAMI|nr:hypothetical protein PHJA_000459400 [Phtheirospermum japonicum]
MAATKSHRYLGCADRAELGDRLDLELDEADVWATNDKISRAEPKKPAATSHRLLRTPARRGADADRRAVGPRSLPVNIPDWSKILRGEYRPRAGEWADEYEGDDWGDDGNDKIPPHEYLARTRVASLSVHEGIGRTLKGRDLSRVRNAIWKKTGFED